MRILPPSSILLPWCFVACSGPGPVAPSTPDAGSNGGTSLTASSTGGAVSGSSRASSTSGTGMAGSTTGATGTPASGASSTGASAATAASAPTASSSASSSSRGGSSPSGGISNPALPGACQGLTTTSGPSQCVDAGANYDGAFYFTAEMRAAVSGCSSLHPEWFETDGETILPDHWADYLLFVMDQMNALGICAVYDGYAMYVRDARDRSEHYTMQWRGRARAFTRQRCEPALGMPGGFLSQPPPNDPWCPLPDSSNEGGECVDITPLWNDVVLAVQQEVVAEQQALGPAGTMLDFSIQRTGDDIGYFILDLQAYLDALIARTHAHGLCANAPGRFDTLALKDPNGGNTFSEAYDVVLTKGCNPGEPGCGPLPAGNYVRSASNGRNYLARCTPPEF